MLDLGWPFQPREEPEQGRKRVSRSLRIDGASIWTHLACGSQDNTGAACQTVGSLRANDLSPVTSQV